MGRSPCCEKGTGLKKGPWTPEEDQKLVDYIRKHGYGNWRTLPINAGLQRCGKSCRLRWTNYLRPDIKRGKFSTEEEETIIHLHSILGNKWSIIAARLPGRTDNEIKNYWNTHIRKKLLRMGIDPVTHSPRLDLLDMSSILTASSQQMMMINLLAGNGVIHQDQYHQQQTLLNPQLLRLAASLFSSRPTQEHQNQPHQLSTTFDQIQEQSNNYNLVQTIDPAIGFPQDHHQLLQDQQFSSNLNDSFINSYGSYHGDNASNSYLWSSEEQQLFANNNVVCTSSTTLNGLSNSSTPESSPPPLYSNNSTSTSYVIKDEKENSFSSGNNIFDFDITTILNNNEFLM